MTVMVRILPTVVLFCEIGITIEIPAKKLSKKIRNFYLLPSPFWLRVLPPNPCKLGSGGKVFQSLRRLPDIMSSKCNPNQILLLGWAGFLQRLSAGFEYCLLWPALQTSNISKLSIAHEMRSGSCKFPCY